MDPIADIAAEGAAPPAPVASGVMERLTSPSPRSDAELSADAFAQAINGFADARIGATVATESRVGEGLMDCIYALMPAGQGVGAASPIGRLLRAAGSFLVRLFALRRVEPQPA